MENWNVLSNGFNVSKCLSTFLLYVKRLVVILSFAPLTVALQPGVPFLIVKERIDGQNLPQNCQKLTKNLCPPFVSLYNVMYKVFDIAKTQNVLNFECTCQLTT